MPPILDAAIGTFFVFMLFSIAVTALNEVVLSFFDKRADFMRLGLGELLSDPQKDNMDSFVHKLGKYASKNGKWLTTWTVSIPVLGTAFEVPWQVSFAFSALVFLGLVLCDLGGWKKCLLKGVARALSPLVAILPFSLCQKLPPSFLYWMQRSLAGDPAPPSSTAAAKAAVVKAAAARVALEKQTPATAAAKIAIVREAAQKADALKTHGVLPVAPMEVPTPEITVDALFKHPLVFSLSKGESDPSYIGSGAFASTIIDLLVPSVGPDGQVTDKPNLESVKASIGRLGNEKLKQSLALLLHTFDDKLDDSMEKYKTAIEEWFNNSMDRVTGWYKRHAQTWLIALAFILAVVGNVDAIRIIQTLSNNPNLAKSVAAQAENYVKANDSLTEPAEVEAALQTKRDALTKAKAELDAIVKPETDAKDKLAKATTEDERKRAAGELAAAVTTIDAKKREAAEQALKNAELNIDLPLSLATLEKLRERKEEKLKKAREVLDEAKKTGDKGKIKDAEQKLDEIEAISLDAAMAQFTNDLKALSATGIPMGWDENTRKRFNILKPDAADAAITGKEGALEWILKAKKWAQNNVNRPSEWKWKDLFQAICGWTLTAIAASLGAPFWFDLLQRIMNLRANGRSPDEKALGTKKPALAAEKPQPSLPAVSC